MNKLLTILFFTLLAGTTIGQRVYSPSVDGVPGRNQPVGISGLPLDGRSMYHDTTITPAKWRDFQSVSEVNGYFNTATKRAGGFTIFIHNGGSLSAGVWTGGTRDDYTYKDGVADGNLVVKSSGTSTGTANATATDVLMATRIAAWGNSITLGTGSSPNTEGEVNGTQNDLYGVGFPQRLESITGYKVFNGGVGGETSSQILTRFLAAPEKWAWNTIIDVGQNNPYDSTQVKADIATMITDIGHTRYIVLGILVGSDMSSGQRAAVIALNNSLATIYGSHFFNTNAYLVSQYNPAVSQDVTDHANNVVPSTLRFDVVHLVDRGYDLIANQLKGMLSLFTIPTNEERTLTTKTLRGLLDEPSNIGSTTPGFGLFKRIVIGNEPRIQFHPLDGNSSNYLVKLNVDGGANFWHPNPNTNPGGISIRSYLSDIGGYANMEISGTNAAQWPSGTGLLFQNYERRVKLGSDFDLTGVFTQTGNAFFNGRHFNQGSVYSNVFGIGDPVTHSALRPVDFSASTYEGMLIPSLTQSAINNQDTTSYLSNHRTRHGEMVFNNSTQRVMSGWDYGDRVNYRALAFLDDITAPTGFAVLNAPNNLTGLQSITGNVATGTIGVENLLTLNKPLNSGVSYAQTAFFNVGSYSNTHTSAAPKTKFSLDLSNGFNTKVNVLNINDSGVVNIPALSTSQSAVISGGIPFGTGSFGGGTTYSFDKAFDYNALTSYVSDDAVTSGNYVGLTLPVANVITSVGIYPRGGIPTLAGLKIQGSNTSTSAGFVDLYTLPSSPPDNDFTYYPITSTTPYKYFRLLQGPNASMDVTDVLVLGYVPGATYRMSVFDLAGNLSAQNFPTTRAGYGITDAAAVTHTHPAADITSGVMAPARLGTGTANSTNFLRGDGTWTTLSGSGDASTNTSSSVDGEVSLFSGTAGKTLKRATVSGVALLNNGVLSSVAYGANGTYLKIAGGVPAFVSDSALIPTDGSLDYSTGVLGVNNQGTSAALYKSVTITSLTYTVGGGVATVLCSHTGGTMTLTLPSASTYPDRRITIKNISTNNVTIANSYSGDPNTMVQYNSYTFQSIAGVWYMIHKF